MAFKDIFKRKEGGTILGNTFRGIVKNASGGLLGNGALMLKPGQTAADNNKKAAQAAGAAAVAFNTTAGGSAGTSPAPGTIGSEVKKGAIIQYIKQYWYFLLVLPVLVWVGSYLFKGNMKRVSRSRRYKYR